MSAKKKLLAGLGALVLAGTMTVGLPAAAQAATSCSGTRIDTVNYRNNSGTVIAKIGVYKNGYKACAVAVKTAPLYGEATYMQLEVSPEEGATVRDAGNFRYQTDALTVDSRATGSPDHVVVSFRMANRAGAFWPWDSRFYAF